MDAEQRFWGRVKRQAGGCWLWCGARTKQGYGELMVKGRMWYAHRYVLLLEGIDIPSGMVVDHVCRNRACVNPAHLRLTTHDVNILAGQGASARNAQKTHCPKGHPYDDTNTWRNAEGDRFCRQCRREYNERNRDRKRAADRAYYQRRRAAQMEVR